MPASDTALRFRDRSPFSPAELELYTVRLMEHRWEMGKSYQGLSDAAWSTTGEASGQLSSTPTDAGELASDNYEQELSIEMMERVQVDLNAIQEALDRITARSYGLCEDCGEAIPVVRLEAAPMARFCIGCQSRLEQ